MNNNMNGWISVEDALPEEDTLVVAAHFYEYISDYEFAACWYLHGSFHAYTEGLSAENYDGGATIELDMEVTHWFPLPFPPTKDIL